MKVIKYSLCKYTKKGCFGIHEVLREFESLNDATVFLNLMRKRSNDIYHILKIEENNFEILNY